METVTLIRCSKGEDRKRYRKCVQSLGEQQVSRKKRNNKYYKDTVRACMHAEYIDAEGYVL